MISVSTSGTLPNLSIDDFGTGYSSLAYLKRLPIDELKIDKSFVQDAPTDPSDAALVEVILAVAQRFSLAVVAKGLETVEQVAFLKARDCACYQGYLYGRPEPAEQWLGTFAPTRVDCNEIALLTMRTPVRMSGMEPQ